jgi:tRNA-binding protein
MDKKCPPINKKSPFVGNWEVTRKWFAICNFQIYFYEKEIFMTLIDFEDFEKIVFICATILEVSPFKRAKKPSYIIKLDCGEYGMKFSSAQITNYSLEELIGKQVVVVLNLKPRNIAGFNSEVLITGFYTKDGECILTSIDKKEKIMNGSRLG